MPDEPHEKDVGRKPGVIHFLDGNPREFGHIDAHDGYVHAQYPEQGTAEPICKIPWHVIEEVRLDL